MLHECRGSLRLFFLRTGWPFSYPLGWTLNGHLEKCEQGALCQSCQRLLTKVMKIRFRISAKRSVPGSTCIILECTTTKIRAGSGRTPKMFSAAISYARFSSWNTTMYTLVLQDVANNCFNVLFRLLQIQGPRIPGLIPFTSALEYFETLLVHFVHTYLLICRVRG